MMLQGHDVESESGLQDLIDKAVANALKVRREKEMSDFS